jgi:cation diffusion facilitator CzcD-associated flavoprotein CzcO
MSKPWPQAAVTNAEHTRAAVVIIGGGVSGICTAIDLIKRNNCRNFVILEKSGAIGGTWSDNRYPGCCCDVWSLLYSFSFEQKPDWTRLYPGQEEILEYLQSVAKKWDLYRHVRFNSDVRECRWDASEAKWNVNVRVTGGKDAEFSPEYTMKADFLVSAVGQLNYPRYPDIEGLGDFTGRVMHSARWDWTYDLEGKRIAVIGNGATAVQIVPEIIKVAKNVTVYSRSPNWVVDRMDTEVSPFMRGVYRYVPGVQARIRAMMMDMRESFYLAVAKDESDMTTFTKTMHANQLKRVFPDDPVMRAKLTPDYHPGCKRILVSDDWFPALRQPNCHLETRHIKKISESGIELEDGQHQEFDLIVLATGFRTVEFMHPIKMYGANGRSISDVWKGGARALYGTMVEDMPNFGMLYGPNTNLGHNSIMLMVEAQSRYISTLVGAVLSARKQGKQLALGPKAKRVEDFNADIQAVLARSNFADPRCESWYKTESGLITNNWSGTVVDYQKLLSKVAWGDFELEGTGADDLARKSETHIGRVVEETQVSAQAVALGIGALSVLAALGGIMARRPGLLRVR